MKRTHPVYYCLVLNLLMIAARWRPRALAQRCAVNCCARRLLSSKTSAATERGVIRIGDVAAPTRQTLKNVVSVLHEGGATVDDVIKCNVYLADIRDFDVMNAEFAKVFPNDPPARTTVEARLAEATMLVEIEAVAWVAPES